MAVALEEFGGGGGRVLEERRRRLLGKRERKNETKRYEWSYYLLFG
jgi:hypothetical protein